MTQLVRAHETPGQALNFCLCFFISKRTRFLPGRFLGGSEVAERGHINTTFYQYFDFCRVH